MQNWVNYQMAAKSYVEQLQYHADSLKQQNANKLLQHHAQVNSLGEKYIGAAKVVWQVQPFENQISKNVTKQI